MQKIFLGSVAALFLASGVAGAAAFDFFATGHADQPIYDTPCQGGVTSAAAPVLIGSDVFVFYTCQYAEQTGKAPVIVRRFKTRLPIAPLPVAVAPAAAIDCSRYPGFVASIQNNSCVPAGHPLAVKP